MTTDHAIEQPTARPHDGIRPLSVEDRIQHELAGLRSQIPGVHACLVVTVDGLLVAHDLSEDEGPAQLGALSSTLLALARHAVETTGRGQLLEAAIRGDTGYFVTYAVGRTAVLAVLGRADLNLAMLHIKTRPVVQRVAAMADDFPMFSSIGAVFDT